MSAEIDWDSALAALAEAEAEAEAEAALPEPVVVVPDAGGVAAIERLAAKMAESGPPNHVETAEENAKREKEETFLASRGAETGGVVPREEVADWVADLTDENFERIRRGQENVDRLLTAAFGPVGREVEKRKRVLKVNELAREDLNAEKVSEGWKAPEAVGIDAFLAEEPEAPSFHISRLWPHGGMVLLTAAKKWGKTTSVRHTIESALTGDPLFGQFAVDSPFSRALLIDNELSARQAWDMWNGTKLTGEQLTLWRLRESLSSLAIREEWVRKELVKRIADTGADLLVVDPLGPLLRANEWDENSNSDVGRCLDLLVEMAAEAGVTSLLIPHHTGHTGANARGASVLGDKADAIWSGTLKRPTDPYGPRLFGAIGRSGVSLRPVELSWDEEKRMPFVTEEALSGESAAEALIARAFVLNTVIADVVKRDGPISLRKMREAVREAGVSCGNEAIDEAYREFRDSNK